MQIYKQRIWKFRLWNLSNKPGVYACGETRGLFKTPDNHWFSNKPIVKNALEHKGERAINFHGYPWGLILYSSLSESFLWALLSNWVEGFVPKRVWRK